MDEMIGVSAEVLTAILKQIDEAIHVVNTEGTTIFYNEVAAKFDGLNRSEVVGKPLLAAFPSLSEKTSTLLKVIKTKQPLVNQTQSYINIHGRKIETINTTLPIFLQGNIIGAVEIAKDYSRIKFLYERLTDLQKGMNQPEKKQRGRENVIYTLADIKTVNGAFQQTKEEAGKLAKSNSPILVFGESGTGKELFVQGVHHASNRSAGPFIAQNCAAIPESLLESILFGTSKGSYTGAVDRPGLFELADGGTLFLDELHTMPFELQAKLLRVLEDGMVRRVGSTKNLSVNVRVISAMNIHPAHALEEQKLRPDLYYRLNVFTFELLPLRERKEDILYLTDHFIHYFNKTLNKQIKQINNTVQALFLQYKWPGNVRELKHSIEYMMNICEGTELTDKDLPVMLKQHCTVANAENSSGSLSFRKNLHQFEQELIKRALSLSGGNILQTAKILEIPRQTLQYKLHKYAIQAAD